MIWLHPCACLATLFPAFLYDLTFIRLMRKPGSQSANNHHGEQTSCVFRDSTGKLCGKNIIKKLKYLPILLYQETTFLTKKEILRVFHRFCEIQDIPRAELSYEALQEIVAKYTDLCKCPELKENPFRKRICKVFSSDDSGNLTFDQFVYLFSVFSDKAPREMKVHFAFKIYGTSTTN